MGKLESLSSRMARVDARITRAIGEVAQIKGQDIEGFFHRGYREIELGDGSVASLDISFDCRYSEAIASLQRNDPVEVDAQVYGFLQRLPEQGTESGWVVLELDSQQ